MNIAKLSAQFPDDAIHWRAQNLTQDGGKAMALAYLDARDVMGRLDDVCGPANWQSSFIETNSGRILCKLELWHEDRWIYKTDGAGSTAVEGEKGGISDALKRAAVQWGIGRYLYDMKPVWAPCEFRDWNGKKQWKAWKKEAFPIFKSALLSLRTITEEQHDELMLMMDGLGFPIARFTDVSKITNLRQLPAEKFEGAKGWIKSEASKMEKK